MSPNKNLQACKFKCYKKCCQIFLVYFIKKTKLYKKLKNTIPSKRLIITTSVLQEVKAGKI